MTTTHIEEVRKFIKVRQHMRGIDHEDIVSVQVGGKDEAHLTASGLLAICDSHANLLEALKAMLAVEGIIDPDDADSKEIQSAIDKATAAIAKAKP
jgi:F0F1-type ATP synthase epsilon subunit